MPNIRIRSWVNAPVDEVVAFYDDPVNLGRLMPPPVRFRLVRVEPAPPQPGSIFEFRYGLGPIQRPWIVRLTDRVENERFVDETLTGPMARFQHSHTFMPGRRGPGSRTGSTSTSVPTAHWAWRSTSWPALPCG